MGPHSAHKVMGTTLVIGRLTCRNVVVQLKHLAQPGFGAPWQRLQTPGATGGTGVNVPR
jgi:hypothetical protein